MGLCPECQPEKTENPTLNWPLLSQKIHQFICSVADQIMLLRASELLHVLKMSEDGPTCTSVLSVPLCLVHWELY